MQNMQGQSADKTQSDILDGINMMQNQLNTLAEHFARMSERLTKIETSVSPKSDAAANLDLAVEDRCKIEGTPINGEAIVNYQVQDPAAATAADQGTLPEDEVEAEPGRPIPPGEPAIPPNHTTLAGLLLYWPSIRALTKHHCEREGQPSSEFRAEVEAPRIDPHAKNVQDLDPHILELAEKAIKALVESTRAFHGLGDKRPVITSVFGTAHAQWGNLLVLSAAFKDPIMGQYVDEKLLRHLFQRTIAFLRQSATATSSLRIDMHILEGLQNDFWGIEPSYNTNTNNTGSAMGNAQSTTPRMSSDSMDMPPPRNTIEGEGTPQMPNDRSTPAPM
ncbi:hypothetical protein ISF_05776 [Cordyceps fumosorosea ARSEF 2679]|uniref:Uncharacterized protein n=1 Tax=Cordyceps fumosorosea (strain ARSEF 2679) TaxID=1081104 RepID=A0A167TM16_CORFA|nr:hypothetical protein ISF_05776 [Cordyceps fumosorosea ARSEF 2679]OAA60737.1 hypothetical protein ISF_05776 [Cordyceps fumosorosea ARSEF 2679]